MKLRSNGRGLLRFGLYDPPRRTCVTGRLTPVCNLSKGDGVALGLGDDLVIGASAATLVTFLLGAFRASRHAYVSTVGKRREHHKRLGRLTADVHLDYFTSLADQSVHAFKNVLRGSDGETPSSFVEYIFVNDFYYLQAVTDSIGAVVFYSVTTRQKTFNPLIWPSRYGNLTDAQPARLGLFTLDQFKAPTGARYFFSGATAPSHYTESFSWGNPGLYRTYFLGYNEAGYLFGDFSEMYSAGQQAGQQLQRGDFVGVGNWDEMSDWLQRTETTNLRRLIKPNSYGVSSQHFLLPNAGFEFRLGPDPHQIRLLNT